MFNKQTTEKIVELWGLGFTATETVTALKDEGITISLHTVYNHRRSLTAQNLIDELIRRQERAILKADADNPALAMKYRNELLRLLLPQKIETDQQITQVNLATPFDADPEMRKLLFDAAAKQKAEKDANNPLGSGS
jgi:hypothetical protein